MGKYEEIVAFFEHLGLSRDPDSVERVSWARLRRIETHLGLHRHGHLQNWFHFLQTCEPNLWFRISFAFMVLMVRRGTKTLVDVTSWLEEGKRLSINM